MRSWKNIQRGKGGAWREIGAGDEVMEEEDMRGRELEVGKGCWVWGKGV